MDIILEIVIAGIGLFGISIVPIMVSKFLQAWDGWELVESEDEN